MHIGPPGLQGDLSAAETMVPCASLSDLSIALSQQWAAAGTQRESSWYATAQATGTLFPRHLPQTASPLNPIKHHYPLLYVKNFWLK
jgi:hypothetical protein